MCLLIALSGIRDGLPLVVAANRDERLDRPATPMSVLRDVAPRVIGGRDEVASGTWLAVNEDGVVAGVTNRPTPSGPDPSKRSRGELPLACAAHSCARDAVEELARRIHPRDYNPSSLLVGDRSEIFAVDLTREEVQIVELNPGVHLLENRPFGVPSPKLHHVRRLVERMNARDEATLVAALSRVLADHRVPEGRSAAHEAGRVDAPPPVGAACVHTERYGTRWSGIVLVGAANAPPRVHYAPGPARRTPFLDASRLIGGR